MRIPVLRAARKTARWVRNKFVNGALILLYHRISSLPSDPQLLCVTPDHFAEHLEILRKQARPISLKQLAHAHRNGDSPERAVVLTFDDGYLDNLTNAKPLLERYEIPATVFVASKFMDYDREFWSDELERLFLRPGVLPQRLKLNITGKPHSWSLGDTTFYSEEAYEHHRGWNVLSKNLLGSRQLLYSTLHRLIRPLPVEEQRAVLNLLFDWAGMKPVVRSTHRTLSANEVVRLAEGDLIEVGSHTETHPTLSRCPISVQRAEILGSKAWLEEILERPVSTFAYPYGYRSDYTAQTIALVKQAGFVCACSASPDLVWRGTDLFQLPRYAVFDSDGEEFARRLERWSAK